MTRKTRPRPPTIDGDRIGRNDAAYWAARLLYAIRAGDQGTADRASDHLRRLGYELRPARTRRTKQGATNGAR